MSAQSHRIQECPYAQTQHDQIQNHLPGYQDAGQLGVRGDVAEADGGENGDGEVQRVGASQAFLIEGRRSAAHRPSRRDRGRTPWWALNSSSVSLRTS